MTSTYQQVIDIIIQSTDIPLTEEIIIENNYSLIEIGYDSMSFTNMLIGIENEFGFPIDPTAPLEELTDVRALVKYIDENSVAVS